MIRLLEDTAPVVGLTADRWDLVLVFMGVILFAVGVALAVRL